jgi:hypothetical protein
MVSFNQSCKKDNKLTTVVGKIIHAKTGESIPGVRAILLQREVDSWALFGGQGRVDEFVKGISTKPNGEFSMEFNADKNENGDKFFVEIDYNEFPVEYSYHLSCPRVEITEIGATQYVYFHLIPDSH